MDFGQLMSLAKQNEHVAKDQLKNSKAPDLEFNTPGKVIKSKPNMTAIQARVLAHQERLKNEQEARDRPPTKLPQGKPARPPLTNNKDFKPGLSMKLALAPKKPLPPNITTGSSSKGSSLIPSRFSNGKVLPPAVTKPLLPNGSSTVGIGSKIPARDSRGLPDPVKRATSGSQPDLRLKSALPPSKPHEKPHKNHDVQAVTKARLPLAPAVPFHEMLRLAAEQQKNPRLPEILPTNAVQKPSRKLTEPDKHMRNGDLRDQRGHHSPSSKSTVKGREGQERNKVAHPGKPMKRTDGLYLKRPEPAAAPEPKGKARAHMVIAGKKTIQGHVPNHGSKDQPTQNGVSQQNRMKGRPGYPPVKTGGTVIPPRGQLSAPTLKNGPNQGRSNSDLRRPLQADSSSAKTLTISPAPQQRAAQKSVYPANFNPFQSQAAAKKRPQPVAVADDDDDEYDDEMDDFIDDTPYDDVRDVSRHIRDIFGYDRRRYVGRAVDEDDVDDMETGLHQQWKEEAISAYIGRKEDEQEEERERQELARERAKKKLKR